LDRKRKNKDGTLVQWRRGNARPWLPEYTPTAGVRLAAEQEEAKLFLGQLREKNLAEPKETI
jgi:hypothetical protein